MKMPGTEVQGSKEWFEARLGKATGSKIADIMAKTKSGTSEKRNRYLLELVTERLTQKPTQTFVTKAMQDGIDREPIAREFIAKSTTQKVVEVGFVPHPTIDNAGASPDGLFGDRGVLEIKALQPHNHTKMLIERKISKEHLYQVQFQLACTQRDFGIYACFNPDFEPTEQIVLIKVDRDDGMIKTINEEVSLFLQEADDLITKIRNRHE